MPTPSTFQLLWPVATAMVLLLLASVGALVSLTARSNAGSTPWKTALARVANASPWRWRDLMALLLLVAMAQVVRRPLSDSVGWEVAAFQGVLIAGILWRTRGKVQPFGAFTAWNTLARHALVRWLAILPVLWFAAFTWQFLLAAAGHKSDFQDAIRLFLETADVRMRLVFAFFAVILAPLAEEFLFRGLLLPLLVRRIGAVAGLVLTTLGFAALHADLGTFMPLAVFSVALSLAYARTGSLWVPVMMHALFNGTNLALLLALARAGVV